MRFQVIACEVLARPLYLAAVLRAIVRFDCPKTTIQLIESQAAIRLETQRLGAPAKLFQALEQSSASLRRPAKALRNDRRRASLLNWSDDSPSLESALQ